MNRLPKLSKRQSDKLGHLIKDLRTELDWLNTKYFDAEDGGPSIDLRASEYKQLLKLQDDLCFWIQ